MTKRYEIRKMTELINSYIKGTDINAEIRLKGMRIDGEDLVEALCDAKDYYTRMINDINKIKKVVLD